MLNVLSTSVQHSAHSFERVSGRTRLDSADLLALVAEGRLAFFRQDYFDASCFLWVAWSIPDDSCLIVITDASRSTVVTVLSAEIAAESYPGHERLVPLARQLATSPAGFDLSRTNGLTHLWAWAVVGIAKRSRSPAVVHFPVSIEVLADEDLTRSRAVFAGLRSRHRDILPGLLHQVTLSLPESRDVIALAVSVSGCPVGR